MTDCPLYNIASAVQSKVSVYFRSPTVRRDLKKKRYEAEGAKEYREANRRVQKAVKKAKEDWIGAQCKEIETCLNKKQQQESNSDGKGSNLIETGQVLNYPGQVWEMPY